MTIPFGRRRLSITLTRATVAHLQPALGLVGMTDCELAGLPRKGVRDHDRGRWAVMKLLYGGSYLE